jgi:membrane protease YdiL (CAAX protease family)
VVATVVAVTAAGTAAWIEPVAGLAAWAVVLVVFAVVAVGREGPGDGLVLGVALAAVVQVVSYTLPGRGFDAAWRLGAVGLLVVPAALVLSRRPELRPAPANRSAVGMAIGLLVVATPLLVLETRSIGGISRELGISPEVLAAVSVAFAAVVEELCFRRIVHTGARAVAGEWAFVLSAIVWASGAAGMHSAANLGLLLGAGLVYGLAYDWSNRWWPGAVSHATVAVLVFVVLPLP